MINTTQPDDEGQTNQEKRLKALFLRKEKLRAAMAASRSLLEIQYRRDLRKLHLILGEHLAQNSPEQVEAILQTLEDKPRKFGRRVWRARLRQQGERKGVEGLPSGK